MDARSSFCGPCFLCHQSSNAHICAECAGDLFAQRHGRCPVCADHCRSSNICGRCLSAPPAYNITYVLADYGYPFNRYIQKLKYQRHPELLALLARLFVDLLHAEQVVLPDALIPVPLFAAKQRQRGFNQALILARLIGRVVGLPVLNGYFSRTRSTRSQSSLKYSERKRNIHKAFKQSRFLGQKRVAIVDDVVTTGSTVNELAWLLRGTGCTEIQVWALAKTRR